MATITSLTPPSSSHGKSGSGTGDWEFSVPVAADTDRASQNPRPIGYSESPVDSLPVSNLNGKIAANSGRPADQYTHTFRHLDEKSIPNDFLAPRAHTQRRDSIVSSNQDGDSVLDLYGGRLSLASHVSDDGPTPAGMDGFDDAVDSGGTVEPDSSKWIHRDKLAKIEGNEAADYHFDVESSRWVHKDKLERIEIRELQSAGVSSPRTNSNTEAVDTPEAEDSHGTSYDPRSSEEQAPDDTPRQPRQFRRNPSYSRIPVASASPHPIPQQFLERSTPLPRTAITSSGPEDEKSGSEHEPARKRSYSAGSAFLLEEKDYVPQAGASPNNSKNSRNPLSSSQRRSAASRTGSLAGKQRTRSNPQLPRPGTSASHATHTSGGTQGSAGKTPEGPPPWALPGYKPDPSLPPDQQIIPTLAKKLQQEQWERDGAYASIYDRELRPLKVYEKGDTEKSSHPGNETEAQEWPLRTSLPPPSTTRQSHTERLVPPPRPGRADTSPEKSSDLPKPSPQVVRLNSSQDEGPKKKGLCCCTIM